MASLKLYSAQICPYAQRTRLVLAHKNIKHETVEIDLANKPEWYTKTVNPLGKVPAIDYNGTILYESLVLCEFLEDLHPEHPVLGTDPVTRAKIRLWISWIDGKFIPSWYGFLTAKTPEDQEKNRTTFDANLHQWVDILNKLNPDGSFAIAGHPTLLDYAIWGWFERIPVLSHYRQYELPQNLPRLNKWLEVLRNDPATKATAPNKESLFKAYEKYAKQ